MIPKESDCSLTTGRSPLDAESFVDGELAESIHCTFVTTTTETSRRDDGTSHALHWVPCPREHNINTAVGFSKLATNPQGVHPFKQLSHFEQPHHAQSSIRVLNVTNETFFVFARNTKPSSRHITRFGHILPPYKTGSPLPRVAHRHFDPQRTAPLLASFQNVSCLDFPVTGFHQSANDLDGHLVAVPECQSK